MASASRKQMARADALFLRSALWARRTIAIIKRMDAFKLMVNQCHFDQRVSIAQLVNVNVLHQIGHQTMNLFSTLRRDIDHCPCTGISQVSAWQSSQSRPVFFQIPLHLQDVVQADDFVLSNGLKPLIHCMSVILNFLRCCVGDCRRGQISFIDCVMGGDNIFYF